MDRIKLSLILLLSRYSAMLSNEKKQRNPNPSPPLSILKKSPQPQPLNKPTSATRLDRLDSDLRNLSAPVSAPRGVEDEKKFEEEMQKALAESMKTFVEYKATKESMDLEGFENMEYEEIGDYHGDKKDLYREYKRMIYENPVAGEQEMHNENSMFPLMESDLSQTYLFLEKMNK